MKIAFIGSIYQLKDEEQILIKSRVGLQNQANYFQWEIVKGLVSLLEEPMVIYNAVPVGTYPRQYKDLILRNSTWSFGKESCNHEIGAINLPLIKQACRLLRLKKLLRKWVKENHNTEELNLIVYSTFLPFLRSVHGLPENVKITLIVTDIPEYDDLSLKQHSIKKMVRSFYNKLIYHSLDRIDKFVLLTDKMKYPLKVAERPYIVMEGIADTENVTYNNNSEKSNKDKKIILYTGTLHYQFGIKNLIEAFKLIDDNRYELWICGIGEAEEEIKELSLTDSRIKFFGYLIKSDVKKLQQKATILVNPRPNEGDYTKYSFPSKTMEYLMSGKPVLMHKLDGVPEEYNDYLIYFRDNGSTEIADIIKEICEKPYEERCAIGRKGQNFVIENKNKIVQAGKIINLINQK